MDGKRRIADSIDINADDDFYSTWDENYVAETACPEVDENSSADWDMDDVAEATEDAIAIEEESDGQELTHMIVKHENLRIALMRQEDAARTEEDFENLTATWDRLDRNREQRERRYEKASTEDVKDFELESRQSVIPRPIDHVWWRQLLSGNFVDIIHDCPLEVKEFTSSRNVFELVGKLKDTQKEVLYYRAIRYWSNQRIAAMRGQTDRNILKAYETLIESLRYKLYMRLLPRFKAKAPLTLAQQGFMELNEPKYGDGRPKRKRRTKAELEGHSAGEGKQEQKSKKAAIDGGGGK